MTNKQYNQQYRIQYRYGRIDSISNLKSKLDRWNSKSDDTSVNPESLFIENCRH